MYIKQHQSHGKWMSFLNLQTFVGKTQKILAVEEEKSCSVVGSLLLVEMKLCPFLDM